MAVQAPSVPQVSQAVQVSSSSATDLEKVPTENQQHPSSALDQGRPSPKTVDELSEVARQMASYYTQQYAADDIIIKLENEVTTNLYPDNLDGKNHATAAATEAATELKKLYEERDKREAKLKEYDKRLDADIQEILRTKSGTLTAAPTIDSIDSIFNNQATALHRAKTALLKVFTEIKKDDPNFQVAATLEQLRMIAAGTCARYTTNDDRAAKLKQDFGNCLVHPKKLPFLGKFLPTLPIVLKATDEAGNPHSVKCKCDIVGQLILTPDYFWGSDKHSVKAMIDLLVMAQNNRWTNIKIDFGTSEQREAARTWLLQNPGMSGEFGTGKEGVTDAKGKIENDNGRPAEGAKETHESEKLQMVLAIKKDAPTAVDFFSKMRGHPDLWEQFKAAAGKEQVKERGIDPLAKVLSRYYDTMMATHQRDNPANFEGRQILSNGFYKFIESLEGKSIADQVRKIENEMPHKHKRLDWLRPGVTVLGVDTNASETKATSNAPSIPNAAESKLNSSLNKGASQDSSLNNSTSQAFSDLHSRILSI